MDDLNDLIWGSTPGSSFANKSSNASSLNALRGTQISSNLPPTSSAFNSSSNNSHRVDQSNQNIFRSQAINANAPVFKRLNNATPSDSNNQSTGFPSYSLLQPERTNSSKPLLNSNSNNKNLPTEKDHDPFNNLVSFQGIKSLTAKKATGGPSLNEQRRLQEQEQKRKLMQENPQLRAHPEFWDSLESKSSTIKNNSANGQQDLLGDWSVSLTPPIGGKTPNQIRGNDVFEDILGGSGSKFETPKNSLNQLKSQTSPKLTPSAIESSHHWDLDFLSGKAINQSNTSTTKTAGDLLSLEIFGLPDSTSIPKVNVIENDDNDEHPLGILAEPVYKTKMEKTSPPQKPPRIISPSPGRDSSKDHLIAQIVDMGFSASEAQTALAATDTGEDVKAAIEILIQQREVEEQISYRKKSGGRRRANTTGHDDGDSSEGGSIGYRARNKNLDIPRSKTYGKSNSDSENSDRSGSPSSQNFQQQKEKLLATAGELGMSAFKKANALYQQSRVKVNRALEDLQQSSSTPSDGRPKWMQDRDTRDFDEDDSEKDNGKFTNISRFERFQDTYSDSSSDDDDGTSSFAQNAKRNVPLSNQRDRDDKESRYKKWSKPEPPPHPKKPDYDQNGSSYISPARRRPPVPPPSSTKPDIGLLDNIYPSRLLSNNTYSPSSLRARSPPPAPAIPSKPPRPSIPVSPETLRTSEAHRTKGNELFKLGQFGEAEQFYSRAISLLPPQHLHIVLLYNNRAAARLKNGDQRGCAQDCSSVLILVDDYSLPPPPGIDINLKEQYSKALLRRAAAFEAMEKYNDAKDDYQKILSADLSSSKSIGEGMRRCQKALNMMASGNVDNKFSQTSSNIGISGQSVSSSTFGVPINAYGFVDPTFAASTNRSGSSYTPIDPNNPAVIKLRNQARQQEMEDAEKLRLKDQVDQRILLWKGGKEGNLRALIGSLDMVLWSGLAWKKVGLHELVTPAQVKVRYMKAIAKVHPDKLDSSTTIEQRLVANGVFSALNYAWDTFKAQNNL